MQVAGPAARELQPQTNGRLIKVVQFIPIVRARATRQLSLIAPQLARMGIETHIAYGTGGPNLPRLLQSDVITHSLKARGNHDADLAFGVLRLVRILRPDIVQTWLPQMDILGGGAALLDRVPLIISERSSAAAYEYSWWKSRLRVAIGKRATRIIAN